MNSMSSLSPRLSLCMIVKNEAETLERCLVHARPHVDEIVILDTGSTDGTQEIARRYADVFEEVEWPGSFAIARNMSISRASGDYILVLDGDEYIPNAAHWEAIRIGISLPKVVALQVRVRNLLPEDQVLEADCIWQERVFRRHSAIRYEGRVHNQILASIQRYAKEHGEEILRADAEIIHTGYVLTPASAAKKYAPRIELLKYEIEKAADEHVRAYYMYQLGTVYFLLQEHEQAKELFQQLNYEALNLENRFYAHMLAAHTGIRTLDAEMALVHAHQMMEVKPNEPMGYYTAAHALFMIGENPTAVQMLKLAFSKNEDKENIRFPINESRLFLEVARLSERAGLPKYALYFYDLYLKQHPEDMDIAQRVMHLRLSAA